MQVISQTFTFLDLNNEKKQTEVALFAFFISVLGAFSHYHC